MTSGVSVREGESGRHTRTERKMDLQTEETHEGSLPQRRKNLICGALHHRNKLPKCNVCVWCLGRVEALGLTTLYHPQIPQLSTTIFKKSANLTCSSTSKTTETTTHKRADVHLCNSRHTNIYIQRRGTIRHTQTQSAVQNNLLYYRSSPSKGTIPHNEKHTGFSTTLFKKPYVQRTTYLAIHKPFIYQ